MLKKFIILLYLIFLPIAAFADDNGVYVGTPPGFYDDIDPNSIEEEDETRQLQNNNQPYLRGQDGYKNDNADINNNNVDINNNAPYQHFYEGANPVETKPTKDYAKIYNDLELANFSYLHNIDPDQYYDMKDTAWSVYPLLRLNSPIYFKSLTIEPGYYLLTPREHDGKWFMLFKQNGVVKHIIPVYDRDYTPQMFYEEHIPKPKLTKAQKIHMGFLGFLGKFNSTKRKEPVKSYLEVNDLDNYFVSIVIYYGGHKYSTLFRTIRL